jgi:hypothetical protein
MEAKQLGSSQNEPSTLELATTMIRGFDWWRRANNSSWVIVAVGNLMSCKKHFKVAN